MDDKVERWLDGLGLSRYAGVFADNEISYDALPHLTQDDLRELGLPMGPRRIVAAAIAALARPAVEAAAAPEDAGPHSAGERRHLTVLFCDLMGSTELSTRLDPEDMRAILRRYQEACSQVIARYDGYVAKFMGDGTGYPFRVGNEIAPQRRGGISVGTFHNVHSHIFFRRCLILVKS